MHGTGLLPHQNASLLFSPIFMIHYKEIFKYYPSNKYTFLKKKSYSPEVKGTIIPHSPPPSSFPEEVTLVTIQFFLTFFAPPPLSLMLKHTVLFVYILHVKWDSTLDFRGPGRSSQAEESLPRKRQGPAPLSSPPAPHCSEREACDPGL